MRKGPITSRNSGGNVVLMVTTHIDTRHMVYKYMESLKSGVVVYSEDIDKTMHGCTCHHLVSAILNIPNLHSKKHNKF